MNKLIRFICFAVCLFCAIVNISSGDIGMSIFSIMTTMVTFLLWLKVE